MRVLEPGDPPPEVLYWVGCAASFDERAPHGGRVDREAAPGGGRRLRDPRPARGVHGRPGAPHGQRVPVPGLRGAERRHAERGRRDEDRGELPALLQHAAERVPGLRRRRTRWSTTPSCSPRWCARAGCRAERERRARSPTTTPATSPATTTCSTARASSWPRWASRSRWSAAASGRSAAAPAARTCGWRSAAGKINEERAREAAATGADTLAVACPFCTVMLDDGVRQRGDELRVVDVATLLAESVEAKRWPAEPAHRRAPTRRPPKLVAERAYVELRDRIVTLRLAPGTVLREDELMREMAIGRTPLREAVKRLALENLVAVQPRRGTFVTEVEAADIVNITEVRAELEGYAAELAAMRMNGEARGAAEALAGRDRGGHPARRSGVADALRRAHPPLHLGGVRQPVPGRDARALLHPLPAHLVPRARPRAGPRPRRRTTRCTCSRRSSSATAPAPAPSCASTCSASSARSSRRSAGPDLGIRQDRGPPRATAATRAPASARRRAPARFRGRPPPGASPERGTPARWSARRPRRSASGA